ncbi:MAG: hypothetical protein PHW20_12050 [Clostridia bacterium]|jgi:hypothetical protein|nr:hypothetical protein [Clostridia bacterium]
MKIVLSRKGFDGTYGGFPSPILEDGLMISLPIPINHAKEKSFTYRDLSPQGVNLGDLFKELGKVPKGPKIEKKDPIYVHLDPDLYDDSLPKSNKFKARMDGWKGLFGTDQAAAGILCNDKTGVDEGDIFLFFGWFNNVINKDGKRGYDTRSQGFHQIWGWLQIGQIIHLDKKEERAQVPEWARYHPHYQNTDMRNNVLFIASDELTLDGFDTKGIKGYGAIKQYNEKATLTEMDLEKNNKYYNEFQIGIGKHASPNHDIKTSLWKLPLWFYHKNITKRLGYHNKENKRTHASWFIDDKYAYLKSTSPGQEFILDLGHYPEKAKQWVLDIITSVSNH